MFVFNSDKGETFMVSVSLTRTTDELRDQNNQKALSKPAAGGKSACRSSGTCPCNPFFALRFLKYIHSLIKYAAIDYYRSQRKYQERYPLLLDAPQADGERTRKNRLAESAAIRECEEPGGGLMDHIGDIDLFMALQKLSPRQLQILNILICEQKNDIEIAQKLRISQQAVNKSKLTALRSLRTSIREGQ